LVRKVPGLIEGYYMSYFGVALVIPAAVPEKEVYEIVPAATPLILSIV
jgi:hypothetical protein